MATSGSFLTTSCKNVSLKFSWSIESQSIENNTTTISWSLAGYRTDGATGYIKCGGFKVVINGSTVYSKSTDYRVEVYNGTVVASGTVTIKHADDGTKSFTASAEAGIYYYAVNCNGSGTFTLTTIPRKSTLSVGNGTLGTPQTLTVTRKATSFTHTITAKCGSASTTVCTKSSSTSISFTPPLTWANQNTTGTSVSVTYTITTYSGSTNVGSNSYTKTCSIPASVKPSCTVTISDAAGYLTTYGAYIKGYSKFSVTVTPKTSYGSAIASYKVTANGSTYTKASFTTGVLKSSGTLTVSATVKDKRGRSSDAAKATATVLDYSSPTITKLTVGRCDEDGTANDRGQYVMVSHAYTFASLNDNNSASYTIKYKKTTEDDTSYSSSFVKTGDGYCIFEADTGSSYDVLMTVTDDLSTTTKTTSVSTAFTLMHWKASGYGMAIGKISELDNVFDIGMQTRTLGGILHPVLEPKTDLNDVRTPNTYVGANVSTYEYGNCPVSLTSGTFSLEVIGMGEEGQVKQKLTYCHKTNARTWERIYYGNEWGEWICVSDYDGQLFWSGGRYMSADHDITLPEPVSKQRSGLMLIFSAYENGASQNHHFECKFVPKYSVVAHPGAGYNFQFSTSDFSYVGTKYLYIYDDLIDGHNNNILYGTQNGVTFDNRHWVLRYVLGV